MTMIRLQCVSSVEKVEQVSRRGVWASVVTPDGFVVVHVPTGLVCCKSNQDDLLFDTSDAAVQAVRLLAEVDEHYGEELPFGSKPRPFSPELDALLDRL